MTYFITRAGPFPRAARRRHFGTLKATRFVVLILLLTALAVSHATAQQNETKLVGYLLGSRPNGLQDVLIELNKRLKKDLNTNLSINYINWSELESKYPLVLAAGDGIDWIYAATWAPFASSAVRGAFKELDMDMIRTYMPRHYAATPAVYWEQGKVNGKLYMIPTSAPDKKVQVAVIRGDLRKKYGIPPIGSFKDIEPYLSAIKKYEHGMIPINVGNGYDLSQPFYALLAAYSPPMVSLTGPFFANYEDRTRPLYSLTDPPLRQFYFKTAATMKSWMDMGYLNRTPFVNNVFSRQSFAFGKSGVGFGNSVDIQDTIRKASAAGYDPEIIPLLSTTGHSVADQAASNGVAIAASSKNWQKSLQMLDLIMEEPSYNYLVYWGIEGKNYVVRNGKIDLPENVSAESNTYPPDAAGFWFVNRDIYQPLASWTPQYIELRKKLQGGILVPSTIANFTFAPDRVKNEVAALTNIMSRYGDPLMVGLVPDVQKAFDVLSQKLKTAGMDKVRGEIKRQFDALGPAD